MARHQYRYRAAYTDSADEVLTVLAEADSLAGLYPESDRPGAVRQERVDREWRTVPQLVRDRNGVWS